MPREVKSKDVRLLIDLKLTLGRANGTIRKSNVRLTDLKVIISMCSSVGLEHLSDTQEVGGSSPPTSTSTVCYERLINSVVRL